MATRAPWSGHTWFGDGWACFEGVCGDAKPHRHLSAQVVAGVDGPVSVMGEAGSVRGDAVLVPAGAVHAIAAAPRARLVFLQPFSPLAACWDVAAWPAAPGVAPGWLVARLHEPELHRTLAAWSSAAEAPVLDARLAAALARLRSEAGLDVAGLGQAVGLSPARLRALARSELGAPLAQWRAWFQLERAMSDLRDGETLAAAAISAGFSDQAHLSRTMRRFLGITPGTTARLIGGAPPPDASSQRLGVS